MSLTVRVFCYLPRPLGRVLVWGWVGLGASVHTVLTRPAASCLHIAIAFSDLQLNGSACNGYANVGAYIARVDTTKWLQLYVLGTHWNQQQKFYYCARLVRQLPSQRTNPSR